MEPRVTFNKDGSTGYSHDWERFVGSPARDGYYLEAFAAADAILDDMAEHMLRMLYSDFKSQDLVNQLHKIRGRTNFDGSAIFLVLLNKKAIDQKFYERVTTFKKDRNLVLHNVESHYNLILSDFKKFSTLKTQQDFDTAATNAAQKSLANAHSVFMDFFKKFHELNGHTDDFFKIPLMRGGKPVDRGPSGPKKSS